MTDNQRKIGFYSIRAKKIRTTNEFIDPAAVKETIRFIDSLTENQRMMEVKRSSKVHLFRRGQLNGEVHKLVFVSAKYNYSPPLINRETGDRRSSPKRLSEGEEEKTHIALKYAGSEVIAVIEERQAGISIGSFVKYLNSAERARTKGASTPRQFVLEYSVIPKDNFLQELAALDRAVAAEIHTTKSLLGSDFLNFSENTAEAKDDLVLTAKAVRNQSLVDLCRDVFHKLHDHESQIRKVRVKGKTVTGREIILDTSIIKKIDFIEAELQEKNGVVKSSDLLAKMKLILEEY